MRAIGYIRVSTQGQVEDGVSLSEKIDTTSAAGKMLFRMLAVLAEFERVQISERTASAMQHRKSKSELVGAVPYGFKLSEDGVHLEVHPEEQETIRIVHKLHDAGLSLRAIASELARQGIRARNGREFQATQVKRMLAA